MLEFWISCDNLIVKVFIVLGMIVALITFVDRSLSYYSNSPKIRFLKLKNIINIFIKSLHKNQITLIN